MISRVVRWGLVVVSVAAYQGLLAEYLSPGGSGLRWDLLIVLLAGLTGGTARGALAGGIVGFVTDCLTPSSLGWGMMVKATLGAAMGMCRERLFLEQVFARWIILAAGVLAHDVVYLLPITDFDLRLYAQTLWLDTGISVIVTSIVGIGVLLVWQAVRKPATPVEPVKPRSTPPA